MLPGASASDPGPAPASAALTASVSDTLDAVRLRIQASGDVEPESVEVRFAGRKAVVLARDAEGRAIRSQPLRLLKSRAKRADIPPREPMKVAFLNAETHHVEQVSTEALVEPAPEASPYGAFIVDAGRRFPVRENVKTACDKLRRRARLPLMRIRAE